MIQRRAYRFPVKLPVTFSGEREGTGVLYDVSVKGCRIVSRTPLRIGHALSLLIYLQFPNAHPFRKRPRCITRFLLTLDRFAAEGHRAASIMISALGEGTSKQGNHLFAHEGFANGVIHA